MVTRSIAIFPLACLIAGLSACAGLAPPDDVLDPTDPANATDYEVPGDAAGRGSLGTATVFGFSQTGEGQEDPQVYALAPDVNLRAWQKWDTHGAKASDYDRSYIDSCRAKGILFIAGGTCSVVFRDEASSEAEFLDWATRDALGGLVEHSEIVAGAYRGSIANPAYRAHLLKYLEAQVDVGVDGVFLDELLPGYNGGRTWGYNGNEGYDDYYVRDFNRYLINKYPAFTRKDWYERFGMRADNIIRRDIPYTDLSRNFNYRNYLSARGLTADPRSASNPLAAEWGKLVGNRYDPADASFTSRYTALYIKDLVVALRAYARDRYSREIFVTSNGIEPFMDFNSLGLYEYNGDDGGADADYVPVSGGRLNGSKSLMPVYLAMSGRNIAAAGDVPLAMFIDWPTNMMNGYYGLPLSDKEDFWRIYSAEAYACGLRFAFHMRTSMPGEPTATDSGVLGFLASYSSFYRTNRDIYLGSRNASSSVSLGQGEVAYNLCRQESTGRYYLHLINHAYAGGMKAKTGLTVTIDLPTAATGVSLVSPDRAGAAVVPYSQTGSTLAFTVDDLEYYDVLAISTR